VSVARFIADQRAKYRVPHAVCCTLLGVSGSWFYTWIARAGAAGPHTPAGVRRAEVDDAVAAAFTVSRGLHGSPRLVADLCDDGWVVSEKTVADNVSGKPNQSRTQHKKPPTISGEPQQEISSAAWTRCVPEGLVAGHRYLPRLLGPLGLDHRNSSRLVIKMTRAV
jgi:hypothetical protein